MIKLSSRRKYLVFSSIGDNSEINSWLSHPKKRIFDVVLYYYGDNEPPSIDVEQIEIQKGLKFQNFVHFLGKNDISIYDAIWVVDDDMIMETKSINKMFKIFSRFALLLAQPSFSEIGHVTWPITRNDPKCVLRYTNFVECNACIFSTKVVPLFLETFEDAGTGYGVDFIWPNLLGYSTDKIAVIDATKCEHRLSEFSELDQVVPRRLHSIQGRKLLQKYNLVPKDYRGIPPLHKLFKPILHSKVTIKSR